MSFDLTYKAELSPESKKVYDDFLEENKEKKEVDYHDVFELIAKASVAFKKLKLTNGKIIGTDQLKQILAVLFDTLVKDSLNDFKEDPRIASIIDTVIKLRNGEFDIDFGRKGIGCLPCCSSVKVSARR